MNPSKCIALSLLLSLISACYGVSGDVSRPSTDNNSDSVFSSVIVPSGTISSKYLGDYTINDEQHRTLVDVTVSQDTRTIVSNALPNHSTGTFPNSGNPNTISAQHKKWTLPLNAEFVGEAVWVREAGVAINGVKFEPETNERISCESGEHYRIEAVQDMVDLGLDDNNAHVQPTGEYHYHGVAKELVSFSDEGNDLVHIGFAADGFLILYSKSSAYKPSYRVKTETRQGTDCVYKTPHSSKTVNIDGTTPDGTYVSDWEYVDGLGNLDKCDGTYINGQYAYIASNDYPYIGRCLNGKLPKRRKGSRPPPPQGHHGDRPPAPDKG